MAEELRIVFMVLGFIAIIALVVHGFYTVRKNKKVSEQTFVEDSQAQAEDDVEFVSKARVVGRTQSEADSAAPAEKTDKSITSAFKDSINRIKAEKEAPAKERVEPGLDATQMQIELPEEDDLAFSAKNEEPDISEQIVARESSPEQQTELEIDAEQPEPQAEKQEKSSALPEEVLILNVVSPQGQVMSGAVLLPTLLTLGFKFGEFNIFHRHEDDSGSGEVLFSLANMFNPGTFDIDNIEQFTTQGVSLFLSLPVSADSTATFNMMHNAAKKIAAEFDGQVLDGQRNVLTRQTLQHYVERIREFERKQLLTK